MLTTTADNITSAWVITYVVEQIIADNATPNLNEICNGVYFHSGVVFRVNCWELWIC